MIGFILLFCIFFIGFGLGFRIGYSAISMELRKFMSSMPWQDRNHYKKLWEDYSSKRINYETKREIGRD